MVRRVSGVFFFVLISLAFIWSSEASAQSLQVSYFPDRDNKLALWVARDAGIFKKYGLDVTLTAAPNGEQAVERVTSKEMEIGVLGFRDAVRPIAEGADLVFIASLAAVPFVFVAFPDIKSVEALKGTKIWTMGEAGAGPDVSTRLVLKHLGLDPEKDVQIIACSGCHTDHGDRERLKSHPPGGIVDPATGMQWILDGKISATLALRTTLKDFQKQGKKTAILADFIDSGLFVTAADIFVRREWLAANRDTAKKFLRAISEATAYAKTHKDFSDATYKKYLEATPTAWRPDSFEDYVLGVLPKKPFPMVKGLEFAIQEKAPNHPFFRQKSAADLIDASLMTEIDKEGFFETLYR
jgi:ABC-type nitrate/sulfonate/bicarbonate transport system substrate-binding protein